LKYLTIKTANSITEEGIQEALVAISTKETAKLEDEETDDIDSDEAEEENNLEETE
jgi:hypothetical protein